MISAIKHLGAAIVVVGISSATTAWAGPLDNCAAYAQNSAKQQQENKLRKCNLSGEYWTTDLRKHVAYCKTNPPQTWKAAFEARKAKLSACK